MRKMEVKAEVRKAALLRHYRDTGEFLVPVTISNRHIHLSAQHVCALFGADHALTFKTELFQPGQYACEETVTLKGLKGEIKNVRVLGPVRAETQVEISVTDSYALGVPPVLRLSGNTAGTPGIIIIGKKGQITIPCGVIVAERHIHLSEEEAKEFGVRDGDAVTLFTAGERPTALMGFAARIDANFALEAHIDTDEANAAFIKNDMLLNALIQKEPEGR